MASNKRLTALALTTALCAVSFAGGNGSRTQSDSERARQLLLKTFDRTHPFNTVAIIQQRSVDPNEGMQRIQVQISKDGRMRQTVLFPLSLQGIERIDDGRQSAIFFPDGKMLMIEESPQLLPNDATTRINLTVRNYGLKLAGTSTIAGKTATIVVATPRSREMETRRYYIDERTGFLLQQETIDSSGQTKISVKTQAVSYRTSLPSNVFDIKQIGKGSRNVVFQRRSHLYESSKNGGNLGFEPVRPDELPCGFIVQDAQVTDEQWRSVAVRITDGLVKGSVYQCPVNVGASRLKAMPGSTVGEGGGLKFIVAIDAPESVRRKILQAFADAARDANAGTDFPTFLGLFDGLELYLRENSFPDSELNLGLLFWVAADSRGF